MNRAAVIAAAVLTVVFAVGVGMNIGASFQRSHPLPAGTQPSCMDTGGCTDAEFAARVMGHHE